MGYKMIEITQEKKSELMEHAEKAYEHIGKMLECVEGLDQEGSMGMRGDEWYIRKMGMKGNRGGYGMRYGMRDDYEEDEMNYGNRYGMRRGRYGNRDPYFY